MSEMDVTTNGKTIAVTGATGNQGAAVVRGMLAEGWHVRALTRDPASPASQALAAQGAEAVPGDMDLPDQLATAFQGANAVFSVQNAALPNVGFAGALRQGYAVLGAAQAAGVQHFIFSSVGGAHRSAGRKNSEVKYQIEQRVQASGQPYTILRPAFFMENFNRFRANILSGTFQSLGLRPDKTLQMQSVRDIAVFAGLALARPQEYLGRTVELAADELTEAQITDIFTRVIGRTIQWKPPRAGGPPPDDEQVALLRFLNGEGYKADIAALRRAYPGLLTLEQYLRQSGWKNAAPVPLAAAA